MSHGAVVVTQLVTFLVKVLLVCSFQILIRWSLPRFRYDQVLAFAWKFMLPLALANLIVTAVLLWSHRRRYEGAYPRKRYWNEPTLTAWERAYLPEIVRGLIVTSTVFLRNMGRWITGRKGALTTYYPEETRADYAPLNRGKHILTQRPDGTPQCIACNMCATVCPAKVIEIDAAFDPPTPHIPSSRSGSRSTIRAASSAACASKPARKTRSAWSRRRPACRRRPRPHVAHPRRAHQLAPAGTSPSPIRRATPTALPGEHSHDRQSLLANATR